MVWTGLIIYSIIYIIETYLSHFPMARLFYGLIGLTIVVFLFTKISFDFSNRSRIVWITYLLMCIWLALMYVRSDFSFYYSPGLYDVLAYSGVLLLLLKPKPMFCSMINYGYKLNYLYLVIFFIPVVLSDNGVTQMISETFPIIAAYIFLTNKYQSNKNILLAIIVLVLALLVATLEARRNLMLTYALYIAGGGIMLFLNGKVKSFETKLIISLFSLLLVVGGIVFYTNQSSGMFSSISNRATENTRDEVFLAYAVDMMHTKDLLIGRGMSGEYYNPGVDRDYDTGESRDYRPHIECGYLEWILKGGCIYLFMYVFLFLMAIWRGIKSKNALCKASAFIVFVQLVDMVPFGLHAFNMKTFMVWLAVSVCLDKTICKMTDDEIRTNFFTTKHKLLPWQKE